MNWSEEWITTAREIVQDEYKLRYIDRGTTGTGALDSPARASPDPDVDAETDTNMGARAQDAGTPENPVQSDSDSDLEDEPNIFEELDDNTEDQQGLTDEVQRYLSAPVENVSNALEWWSDRRASFPRRWHSITSPSQVRVRLCLCTHPS